MDDKAKSILPGQGSSRPGRAFFGKSLLQRQFADGIARNVVTAGGWIIIASIFAILFVIISEIYPLFKKPSISLVSKFKAQSVPLAIGLDPYQDKGYTVEADGVRFYSLSDKKFESKPELPEWGSAHVTGVSPSLKNFPVLGLSDGRVYPINIEFRPVYNSDSQRSIEPHLSAESPVQVRPDGSPVTLLTHIKNEQGYQIAAQSGPGQVSLIKVRLRKTMMGTIRRTQSQESITVPVEGKITSMIFDEAYNSLLIGTSFGQIFRADLENTQNSAQLIGATSNPGIAVEHLGFTLGGYTLIVTESDGRVSSFQLAKSETKIFSLKKIYNFSSHKTPAKFFSFSLRNKGFLTGSNEMIRLHYGTTGETQIQLPAEEKTAYKTAIIAPKFDGILTADTQGILYLWKMENPYPQISLEGLFGEIWYEGYEEPTYVWQSTGGTDEFESKFSLVPLMFGTLKGTLYAMCFAVPLALFASFYVSQFMQPDLKRIIKPTIETMAALPSVVLGFFAALVIAPQVETFLPGIMIMPIIVTIMIVTTLLAYEKFPALQFMAKGGREIYLLIVITFLGGVLSFYAGTLIESSVLLGDHRVWLKQVFDVTYDQRNALVVGLAMGFAVIPIIFTIAEDSLSNVPEHLKASSLALGATPWQTALNVILPTASPGIFSAIMIGFGRAIGETMIVLMATGNTPVMEWSIFNGFRALSANIAVELPEAPEGGTLFRILFLAAFLLFTMTFFVNTLAELVRLRLRKRYQGL
ncbi:MAG: ABC transporter permease subunit [Nitrospina sp.]|nr:ABC transporter permease subunit [Nitrospina sp.]MBT5633242.1 ABC transporter permease subunit [Nitrospina sp.]